MSDQARAGGIFDGYSIPRNRIRRVSIALSPGLQTSILSSIGAEYQAKSEYIPALAVKLRYGKVQYMQVELWSCLSNTLPTI